MQIHNDNDDNDNDDNDTDDNDDIQYVFELMLFISQHSTCALWYR